MNAALLAAEQDWLASASGADVRGFYASLGVELPEAYGAEVMVHCFARPEAHNREDRVKSCSVNLLTGLWCCHGCGEKGNAFQVAMLFGRRETDAAQLAQRYSLWIEREKGVRLPDERQIKKWRQQLLDSPKILKRLEELKGWTVQAISRCGLGWDGQRLVFTIRDHKLKKIGVVRYLPGGDPKMLSLPGSRRGLFPPPETMARSRPLFVVEGEPDAVSVRSCGFQATGVPGVQSWRDAWAKRLYGRRVVVLPDCDRPGRELAERVARVVPGARVVDLGPTCEDGSDIGDWVARGRSDVVARVLGRLAEDA